MWADMDTLQGVGVLPDGTYINTTGDEYADRLFETIRAESAGEISPFLAGLQKDQLAWEIAESEARDDPVLKQKIYEDRREVFRNRDMSYYEIPDVTEWFNDLLHTAKERTENQAMEELLQPGAAGVDTDGLMFRWFTTQGEYDLKQSDELKAHSLFLYNGEIVSRDAFANIMYGYICEAMGIDHLKMYLGGHFQQLVDSGKLDDDRDKERIREGVMLFHESGFGE